MQIVTPLETGVLSHLARKRIQLRSRLSGAFLLALIFALGLLATAIPAHADNPNGNKGLPTQTWPAGTELHHFTGHGGRLVTWHRGYLYLMGYKSDRLTSVWDISDPENPVNVWEIVVGTNGHNWAWIGDAFHKNYGRDNAITAIEPGNQSAFLNMSDPTNPQPWSGPLPGDPGPGVTIPTSHPAGGNVAYTFPLVIDTDDSIEDMRTGEVYSTVNLEELAGTDRRDHFMVGNLLVITPLGGFPLAVFDLGDPRNPQLLDTFSPGAAGHLDMYTNTNQTIYGHYVILLGEKAVIDGGVYGLVGLDISDPTDLKFGFARSDVSLGGERYIDFQDHYGFVRGKKVDMDKIIAGEADVLETTFANPVGDFEWLPVGHLVIGTSGLAVDTAKIYCHQDTLDTSGPSVSWHHPFDGSENLPLTTRLGLVIHETLDHPTLNGDNIKLREVVSGHEVPVFISFTKYDVLNVVPTVDQNAATTDIDLKADTEYELVLLEGGILDAAGNPIQDTTGPGDGIAFRFTFRTTNGSNTPPSIAAIDFNPASPATVGTEVTVTATADDMEGGLEYRWDFADGTALERNRTDWSASPSASNTFTEPGNYAVTLQVRDDHGIITAMVKTLVVTEPVAGALPTQSTSITLDSAEGQVWSVNPDNDSVARIETGTELATEFLVGKHPMSVAVGGASADQIWIACRDDDSIWVLDSDGSNILNKIELDYGARPVAVVFDPNGQHAYVAEEGRGRITKIRASDQQIISSLGLADPVANGLTGQYFATINHTQWEVTRVDSTIDFDWGPGSPDPALDGGFFSIRWIGRIVPEFTETYTFEFESRGGPQTLWIDGLEVASGGQFTTTASGDIALVAGREYDIMLELSHLGEAADAILRWSSASLPEEVVPSSRLLPQFVREARPRALAVTGDGATLLATQFISENLAGRVWSVDLSSFTMGAPYDLPQDATTLDGADNGRGDANYLTALAIRPGDDLAWLVSKKDNILRGEFRDGEIPDFETTLRAQLASLDLSKNIENIDVRVDIDDHGMPSGVTFSPHGNHAFVTLQDGNRLVAIDGFTGEEVARIDTGLSPQDAVFDPATNRVWVRNFMSRSVSVIDASGVVNTHSTTGLSAVSTIQTVAPGSEALDPAVLRGKQLFYSARDIDNPELNPSTMTTDGYISCAACHLDGGHDGRTWDFTNRGEGLRNTISLRGRSGTVHGNVHWSANFDEIQDFELDIVNHFGGTGFLTSVGGPNAPLGDANADRDPTGDLDTLAAYLASLDLETLPRSPHREGSGNLTEAAERGKELFNGTSVPASGNALACATCHDPALEYTDSTLGNDAGGTITLHDVGTIKPGSGERLGGGADSLTGIDTPTLLGIHATAPYLHDGSASTIDAVFDQYDPSASLGTDGSAHNLSASGHDLTAAERADLVAFLQELDGQPASGDGVHDEVNGQVVMEAEDGAFDESGGPTVWSVLNDGNASNGEYIVSETAHQTGSSPNSDNAGMRIVSYHFDLSGGEDYEMFARRLAPNGGSDSVFWRLIKPGESNPAWQLWHIGSSEFWSWRKAATSPLAGLPNGSYTFEVTYRESDTQLDKFVIQKATLADISGTGLGPDSTKSDGGGDGGGGTEEIASDGFESGTWTGGTGWADSGWATSNGGGSKNPEIRTSDDGSIFPFEGSYFGRVRHLAHVTRTVDLAGKSNASLSFQWAVKGLTDNGEKVVLEVSTNGSNWTELASLGQGTTNYTWNAETVDLSDYEQDGLRIRFRVAGSDSGDACYFDDIKVTASTADGGGSGAIDFGSASNLTPYNSNQDQGIATVSSDGGTNNVATLESNAWKQFAHNVTVGPDTRIKFKLKVTGNPEIVGIALGDSGDTAIGNIRSQGIQLYGDGSQDTWFNTSAKNSSVAAWYDGSGNYVQYDMLLSDFTPQGSYTKLIFVGDDDSGEEAVVSFKDVEIVE